MERPALRQLLFDIDRGQVDCVVVYKVDRLSRSLLDFARIMEVFDKKGVSFVSVTQQFNTTASLGRHTLNILLSFAQFEREIIANSPRRCTFYNGLLPQVYLRYQCLRINASTARLKSSGCSQ